MHQDFALLMHLLVALMRLSRDHSLRTTARAHHHCWGRQMPSKMATTPCFLRESCPLTVILPGSTRARMLPPLARKRPPHEGVGEVTKASPRGDLPLQAFSQDLTQSIPGSSPTATFSPLPDTWMLSRGLPVSGHSL